MTQLPSLSPNSGADSLLTINEEPQQSRSKWQQVLLDYRLLEFTCILVMGIIGAIFSFIEVHQRAIPNIEVKLSATTTYWARDPSINLEKLPQQVPMWLLLSVGGIVPIAINLFINYVQPRFIRVRSINHDIRDFLLTFAISIAMAFLLTQFMKNMTGRFRPSFYDMCGWQFDAVWDGVTNLCTNKSGEKEARKSFPSGHASFAWSAMLPLTLYLLGRSRLNSETRSESVMRGVRRTFKLFICFIPCLAATWVAMTRSIDNWHHYADIVAGSIIGAICASLAYSYNYGSVFSWESAGIPNQEYHKRRRQKNRELMEQDVESHTNSTMEQNFY